MKMVEFNDNNFGVLGGTFDPPHLGHLKISSIAIKKLKVPKSKVGLLAIAPGYNESMHEGKNDYSARFGKTDITIKNGHKLTDEDSLYDMYEKIGKVIIALYAIECLPSSFFNLAITGINSLYVK